MKSIKPYLVGLLLLITVIFVAEFMRRRVGAFAGSYPFAASWTVETDLDTLQLAILSLQAKKPQLFPPKDRDSLKKDTTAYWHKINFLYDNKFLSAAIRGQGKHTTILLIKVINTKTGVVKLINRDFNYIAHRKLLKQFEQHILAPITAEIDSIRIGSALLYKGVQLTVDPKVFQHAAIPDVLSVHMLNNSSDTIITGLHYQIEYFENQQWKDILPKNLLFNDLGWELKPQQSQNFEKELYKDSLAYKAGKYRIVKHYVKTSFQKKNENFVVYGSFVIE